MRNPLWLILPLALVSTAMADSGVWSITRSPATGIGPEKGVMRRDPSDIIKVGGTYHVWYTRGKVPSGYDATVYHAISPDGNQWTETGEALARGPTGAWDEQSVFTPNILVSDGKYRLFYTGVPKPFTNGDKATPPTRTAIGLAVADSPNGPWTRLDANPVLTTSTDPEDFDSLRVDDACLIVRDGKFWLYYKGRQWGKSPAETKMGVAIAEQADGPYRKHPANPVVRGGHEVLVWPQGAGVTALIGSVGPKGVSHTLQHAPDGITFHKSGDLENVPQAPGACRPEAFTGSKRGTMIEWGVHIGTKKGFLPFLERFDLHPAAFKDTL